MIKQINKHTEVKITDQILVLREKEIIGKVVWDSFVSKFKLDNFLTGSCRNTFREIVENESKDYEYYKVVGNDKR